MTVPSSCKQPHRHNFRVYRPAELTETTYDELLDILWAKIGPRTGLHPRPFNKIGATLLQEETIRTVEKSSRKIRSMPTPLLKRKLQGALPETEKHRIVAPILKVQPYGTGDKVHVAAILDAPNAWNESLLVTRALITAAGFPCTRTPGAMHISFASLDPGFDERIDSAAVDIARVLGDSIALSPVNFKSTLSQ